MVRGRSCVELALRNEASINSRRTIVSRRPRMPRRRSVFGKKHTATHVRARLRICSAHPTRPTRTRAHACTVTRTRAQWCTRTRMRGTMERVEGKAAPAGVVRLFGLKRSFEVATSVL